MPAMPTARILVVDDEKTIRWSLRERLVADGHDVDEAEDVASATRLLERSQYDLLILDFQLPDGTGIDVLKKAKALDPEQLAIIMTAFATVRNATEAMRLGAYDYLDKPFDLDELALGVAKALETLSLRREVGRARSQERTSFGVDNILGRASVTEELRALIRKIARSGASSILITGESGTGKGLVARAIHYEGAAAAGPFMNITCTALPETLLESELFGHERGAFTDARNAKQGLLELAGGGTAFLDEIGDMPLKLQAKLLRFLEDKSFRKLGGTRDLRVDVRIIAATNKDLKSAVQAGTFRGDLFYRLNVIPLHVPALRERRDDIEILARKFVADFNLEFRRTTRGFTTEALAKLKAHAWPGNVRELRNVVERAVLLAEGDELDVLDLPADVRGPAERPQDGHYFVLPASGLDIEDVERDLIEQALAAADGNKSRAGRLLNLKRDQVRYWMKKYGLLAEGEEGEQGAAEDGTGG
ncbi:MAG: sigma-54 dependent transcriptional regulator [Planctomycetota bacterium]